jgi:protein-export membrane protein SecD
MSKILKVVLSPFVWLGKIINKIFKPIFFPSRRGKIRLTFLVILALVLVAGIFNYPMHYNRAAEWVNHTVGLSISKVKERPFHLGLDLQGGTHLVYEADVSNIDDKEKDDAVEGVRDVIERRVNFFGVSEPLVQTNRSGEKYRVIVELAGVKDVNEAIKMIGETPLLEFKEQAQPRDLTEEEKVEINKFNDEQKNKADELLDRIKEGEEFGELAKEYSEDNVTKEESGYLGFIDSAFSPFADFYNKASEVGENQLVSELVQTHEGYNIVKIGDKENNGVEIKARHILICWQGVESCDKEWSKEDAKQKIDDLKNQANVDNFEQLAKENSTEPGADSRGGDLGWFGKGRMVKEFEDAVFAQEIGSVSDVVETQFGYHLISKEDERDSYKYEISRILLKTKSDDKAPPTEQWQDTGLTGKQLKRAQVVFDANSNQPQVSLEFNDEGKELFAQITERNVDQAVAIFLDKHPISVPRVNEPIRDGSAVITGSFTIPEAKTLSQRLNSGALPVPINLLSQQTVGATLGRDSVQKSLKAGIIGLFFVMVFMLLYYRLPGLLADLALICYSVLVLAIFKLYVTLTLAGIAGFILSIGMAVDANVLIFERLREELRFGKPLKTAIEDGFKRAWPSIRDGNVSTLITCLILFQFGTSVIKGFAITLTVGILASMFSAIIITRVLLRLFSPWFGRFRWIFLDSKKEDVS